MALTVTQVFSTKWDSLSEKDRVDFEQNYDNINEFKMDKIEENGVTMGEIIDPYFAELSFKVFAKKTVYIFKVNIADIIKFNIVAIVGDEIRLLEFTSMLKNGNQCDTYTMQYSNMTHVDIDYEKIKEKIKESLSV